MLPASHRALSFASLRWALALLALSMSATAQIVAWIPCPLNCREYAITRFQTSWTAARSNALAIGARLATIHSAEEQAWIDQTFGGPTNRASTPGPCSRPEIFWIGLSRFDPSITCVPRPPARTLPERQTLQQSFEWVDGSAVTFQNWGINEPNNFCDVSSNPACLGIECAVNVAYKLPNQQIGTSGYWNDAPDARCFYALYERDRVGYQVFGSGCGAQSGAFVTPPTLSASAAPLRGQTFTLTVQGLLPSSPGVLMFGGWASARAPQPLDVIGMTGCAAHLALDQLIAQEPLASDATGQARLAIPIPLMTDLEGFALINQFFHAHPGANALGLIATQGGCGVIR